MKAIYVIELHPLKKNYLKGYFSGFIVDTNKIKDAKIFNTYYEAQKELQEIVRLNDNDELYISILEMYKNID